MTDRLRVIGVGAVERRTEVVFHGEPAARGQVAAPFIARA
jgi:hypothetical protein